MDDLILGSFLLSDVGQRAREPEHASQAVVKLKFFRAYPVTRDVHRSYRS